MNPSFLETVQSPVYDYLQTPSQGNSQQNFNLSYHNNNIVIDLQEKLPSKIQYEHSIYKKDDAN